MSSGVTTTARSRRDRRRRSRGSRRSGGRRYPKESEPGRVAGTECLARLLSAVRAEAAAPSSGVSGEGGRAGDPACSAAVAISSPRPKVASTVAPAPPARTVARAARCIRRRRAPRSASAAEPGRASPTEPEANDPLPQRRPPATTHPTHSPLRSIPICRPDRGRRTRKGRAMEPAAEADRSPSAMSSSEQSQPGRPLPPSATASVRRSWRRRPDPRAAAPILPENEIGEKVYLGKIGPNPAPGR